MENTGCGLLTKRVFTGSGFIGLKGICAVKLDGKRRAPDPGLLQIRSRGDERHAVRSRFSGGRGIPFIKGYRLFPFELSVSFQDAAEMDIQNKLDLYYNDELVCDVNYSLFARREGTFHNTRVVKRDGRSMYFRQSATNRLWFVVRQQNFYDSFAQRLRVAAANMLAKIQGESDLILMYEKESSRYEESASVLFERLVDEGYQNVWYILPADHPVIPSLDEKYRQRLIAKNSFRHLLYFFRCTRFVGTETVDHAMQLRAANRHIMTKTQSRDLTHVFLQHGVMYMVSMDADLRVGFISRKVKKYRAVVSSEAEAMHFMLLGGFSREELYITGLAKFDRSFREPDSDLIMIMPTWRRWETNQARKDFTQTGYYRMLEKIVSAVPQELRSRIVIKPHPLMQSMMEGADTELSRYLRPDMTHDEVLRRCRLLITDYSSIAYDAFYRGANVIFYWEEMEACMRHYGGAHLMINEYNIFGDVCRSEEELAEVFDRNYSGPQKDLDIRRYRRIVSWHDGRNTERIIECMKKDQII